MPPGRQARQPRARRVTRPLRLGINIDHVATVRNARGGRHPDPFRAAELALAAGADGITAHLREDRRHITDADMRRLARELTAPLNFEMAATEEMVALALELRPHACCLVPEKRSERTTEGGLDVVGGLAHLAPAVAALAEAGIRVSLFVEPDSNQLEAARAIGAAVVELHTGTYCHTFENGDTVARDAELSRLAAGARTAAALGLEVHAGHGLAYDSVGPIAALPEVVELNIGHFLVGEAIFVGFEAAIRRMRAEMDASRGSGSSGAGA
jgi:pyridoxine 5-phosphate synthase